MRKVVTRLGGILTRWILPQQTYPSIILNWSELQRCEFILLLGILLNGFCLCWKTLILSIPSMWVHVHLPVVYHQFWFNLFFLLTLPSLIYLCRRWHDQTLAMRYLPYLCIFIFCIMMWWEAYIVGIFSPVTAVLTVSFIGIGLVLINIKVLMVNLILTSIAFIIAASLTAFGYIDYAPIFNFNHGLPYQNAFWIFSMLGLLVPVFSFCLMLMYLMLRQWREREAHFRKLSRIDGLTQVLNRRSINQLLDKMAQNLRRQHSAIVLIDLDFFKEINDQHGHLTGDLVLTEVAHTLKHSIRAQDIIGRYGGEEFILILHDCSEQEAVEIAERCRQAIRGLQLMSLSRVKLSISASFGIAIYHSPDSIYEVLQQADDALYAAKSTGRDQVRFATQQNETLTAETGPSHTT